MGINIRLVSIVIVSIGIIITIDSTYDDFDDLTKFLEMVLRMDCCVRVLYGGSVRREDGMFEDMEEELEWFDESPSFNDLCVRLNAKFDGDFTLKGRFDTEKTRAHYVLMPMRNPTHWSRYTRVLQGYNVPKAEVVVENGYEMQGVLDGPSIDGVAGNEQEFRVEGEATQGNMDFDGQLT